MKVFLDESYGGGVFVMAAVVTNDRQNVIECIKIARSNVRARKCKKHPLKIVEFKEKELHREHPDIKRQIMEDVIYKRISKLRKIKNKIKIFAVYSSDEKNQEESYVCLAENLLNLIINAEIHSEVVDYDIQFDEYKNKAFMTKFYHKIKQKYPEKNLFLKHGVPFITPLSRVF